MDDNRDGKKEHTKNFITISKQTLIISISIVILISVFFTASYAMNIIALDLESVFSKNFEEKNMTMDINNVACKPPGITHIKVVPHTYTVEGSTLKEIGRQLSVEGTEFGAVTKYNYEYEPYLDARGRVVCTNVIVTIDVTLPSWPGVNNVCKEVKDEWNRFLSKAQLHEQGHVNDIKKTFKDIHRQLLGKPDSKVKSEFDAKELQYKKIMQKYDRDTRHGRVQGAELDTTVKCECTSIINMESSLLSSPTSCNDQCVDTNTDPKNCGSCGNACLTGQECNGGQCSKCPAGQVPGTGTDAGKCVRDCGSGSNFCTNTGCTNINSDHFNCGACGNSCPKVSPGTSCVNGVCSPTVPKCLFNRIGPTGDALCFTCIGHQILCNSCISIVDSC